MVLDATALFLQMSPDVALVVDGQLRIVQCNAACDRWLQRSPAELLGDDEPGLANYAGNNSWLHSSMHHRLIRWLEQPADSVEPLGFTWLGNSSSRRWVEATRRQLSPTTPAEYLLVLRDRSESFKKSEQLALELDRLQSAVRNRSIGIYEHDHRTDEIYGSPEVREHYGLEENKPLSIEVFAGASHPDDGEYLVSRIAKAHDPSGDGIFDVRHRILTPAGETRWLHTCAKTYFEVGDSGQQVPRYTLGSSEVITRTHGNELAVRRLAAILDTTPDLVATTDLSGGLTYLNEAGRRLAGLASDAALAGRTIDSFMATTSRERFAEAVQSAVAQGVWRGELQLLRHSQAPVSVLVVVLAHQQTRSNGVYLSVLAHDLSEVKALEEQFRHAQKLEAIGQLAGGIAHDFNNLLSVIFGYTSLIYDDPSGSDIVRSHAEEVLRAGERASELTAQLLSFSRKQVSRPRVVSVNTILGSIESMVSRLVGETIEVALAGGPEQARIHADPHQLEQVLMNLVVNARDAMIGGGKLTVQCALLRSDNDTHGAIAELPPGEYVSISVRDTGCGMSRETQERIFEPFFTTKPAGVGTGLGLSTAIGIVRQNEGKLYVDSAVDWGSTFTMVFPTTDKPVSASVRTVQKRRPDMGGEILVVEDEPKLQSVLIQVLRDAGYSPIASRDAVDALKIARERSQSIALILTDIVMPKMSGKQLADQLAQDGSRIPVLFMSGYAENTVVHHGVLDTGINFLSKPFTPIQLTDAIARVLLGEPIVPPSASVPWSF